MHKQGRQPSWLRSDK